MPTYCTAFIEPMQACEPAPIKIPTKKEKEDLLNFIAEYNNYSIIERHSLYNWLLEYAENCRRVYTSGSKIKGVLTHPPFYFCYAIDKFNKINTFGLWSNIRTSILFENLPELMAFKPDEVETRDPWFDYDKDPEALEKRIFILECCVILTSPE